MAVTFVEGGRERILQTAFTLAGVVSAQSNTSYETAQVRSISLSTSDPTGGSNGQIWFKYTT